MARIEATFSGKIQDTSRYFIPDQDGHEISAGCISGTNQSSDGTWNGVKMTCCASADIVNFDGKMSGYFWNDHLDGDRSFGLFDATCKPAQGGLVIQGSFQFSGGTGKFEKLTGGGRFRSEVDPDNSVKMTWDGTYEP